MRVHLGVSLPAHEFAIALLVILALCVILGMVITRRLSRP